MLMLAALVVAFVIAVSISWFLAGYRGRFAAMDKPNERSLHSVPTPRTGGIAVIVAVLSVVALLDGFHGIKINWLLLAGALPIILVSLADDFRHVPAILRLAAHLGAATWVVIAGDGIAAIAVAGYEFEFQYPVGTILTIMFVTWMINLYNFMDGMDGFAGGMAVFGFGCFLVLGLGAGDLSLAALSGAVTFAAAGFLVFNFPPARLFLGDAGASLLGFLAAIVILRADREGVLPFLGGIVVFSPFIVDATVTLLRRLWAREAVWRAHRGHFYQRLVASGWSHRRTVLWEYSLMLATAISAILLFYNNNPGFELGLLIAWAVIYTGLGFWVGRNHTTR